MTTTADRSTVEELERDLRQAERRVTELEERRPSGGDPSEIREDADRIDRELRRERATAKELRRRLEERRAEDRAERAQTAADELASRVRELADRRPDPANARDLLSTLERVVEDESERLEEATLAAASFGVLRAACDGVETDDLPELEDAEAWAETLAEVGRVARRLAKQLRKADQRASARASKITALLASRPPSDQQARHAYSRAMEGRHLLSEEVLKLAEPWIVERLRSLYRSLPPKHRRKVVDPPGPAVEDDAPEGRSPTSPAPGSGASTTPRAT